MLLKHTKQINMDTNKEIGIWMDHSVAEIIDVESEANLEEITSEFTVLTKGTAIKKGEFLMHNKEQQMHEAYYKAIGDKILEYDHVLLFGPTNAKTELYNYLEKDLHFKDIIIDVVPADKMTENQKQAFVINHFKNYMLA